MGTSAGDSASQEARHRELLLVLTGLCPFLGGLGASLHCEEVPLLPGLSCPILIPVWDPCLGFPACRARLACPHVSCGNLLKGLWVSLTPHAAQALPQLHPRHSVEHQGPKPPGEVLPAASWAGSGPGQRLQTPALALHSGCFLGGTLRPYCPGSGDIQPCLAPALSPPLRRALGGPHSICLLSWWLQAEPDTGEGRGHPGPGDP